MIKKILLGFAALVGLLVIAFFIFINTGPSLPPGSKEAADNVLSSELPELITGETGVAKSGDLDIWYEVINPVDSPRATVLLVMGYATTALAWPDHFIQPLVDSGYQVVRFDNRGVGMSDWVENWDADNPYTLEDMGEDAIAILDDLGVEKAHVVGTSMGGMIAQRMAINHSDRLLTLTSIMSSGYAADPNLPSGSSNFQWNVLKLSLKYGLIPSERNAIFFVCSIHNMLAGDGGYDLSLEEAAQRTLYEVRHRRGMNRAVPNQHASAIITSGSLYDKLGSITAPTLVIHGKSDPLVLFEHGEKNATMISNAKTIWIDGMGHDFPPDYTPLMVDAMLDLFAGR